ncbi:hypothetical protein L596_013958 [Steinernema carpocapsae]|uniref:AB hydrolase-1 domain-containing protein n=1 Tax=Steinernema carpocapsae TaxID=34508 RepID=A0A4U5NBM6_STECR|nr:hypothetical protein L596_013958 [Steinernema carpocapsae]
MMISVSLFSSATLRLSKPARFLRFRPFRLHSTASSSTFRGYFDSKNCLRKETIAFDYGDRRYELDSVIQDTLPSGSDIGTVIGLHGAPGSHKDWKYVVPHLKANGIRFIGVNFPGFGHSQYHDDLTHDNQERVNYVQAILDYLNLDKNLVFIGHSRGTENALKMAALNAEKTAGLVQMNFVGLRTHRGIRPEWIIKTFAHLWQLKWPQSVLRPFLAYVYNNIIKLRVPNGDVAGCCIISMLSSKFDLPGQLEYVEMVNRSDVSSLFLYAGRDPFIEADVSAEFVKLFDGHKHFECEKKTDCGDARKDVVEALTSGTRSVAVHFKKEDHYLQKNRAQLVAEGIVAILRNRSK